MTPGIASAVPVQLKDCTGARAGIITVCMSGVASELKYSSRLRIPPWSL